MNACLVFLDDETMVLQSLRRALHSRAKTWDMHLCENVEQLWAIMDKRTVDVLVTDLQMPGLDGASVVSRVREQSPETLRFVLSGFKDRDAAIRTPSAHRFFMKPILVTQLEHNIETSLALAAVPLSQRKLMNGTATIISGRAAVDNIRKVFADAEPTMADMIDAVLQDPAVTAKVLQLGNSGVFSSRRAGADIEACLQIIGVDSLRSYVQSDELVMTLPDGDPKATKANELLQVAQSKFRQATTADSKLAGLLSVVGDLIALDGDVAMDPETSHELSASLLQIWGIPNVFSPELSLA